MISSTILETNSIENYTEENSKKREKDMAACPKTVSRGTLTIAQKDPKKPGEVYTKAIARKSESF